MHRPEDRGRSFFVCLMLSLLLMVLSQVCSQILAVSQGSYPLASFLVHFSASITALLATAYNEQLPCLQSDSPCTQRWQYSCTDRLLVRRKQQLYRCFTQFLRPFFLCYKMWCKLQEWNVLRLRGINFTLVKNCCFHQNLNH